MKNLKNIEIVHLKEHWKPEADMILRRLLQRKAIIFLNVMFVTKISAIMNWNHIILQLMAK